MHDKRRALLLVAMFALATAPALMAGDLAKSMQGKWKADMAATVKESGAFKSMSPEEQKKMLEQMAPPGILLEFTDTTAVVKAGDEPAETAAYTITKTEGRTLHLDVLVKKDGQDRHEVMAMEIVDADNARMSRIGEDFVLVLHRVK
jgi:hypothetical protein